MVAVVAGNGLGLFNTSVNVLGNAGVLGQGALGQSRAGAYVNAVTGNLILQSLDEEVSGRGADLQQLLTYNSKGTLNGGAGQGWLFSGQRTLVLTGTVNTAGSFVDRTDSDGHVTRFTWDVASKTYLDNTDTQFADGTVSLAHEGGGPDDTITWNGSQWTFVIGSTQQQEIYSGTGSTGNVARLLSQSDPSGNVVSYHFDSSGRLDEVIDNNKLDGTGTGSGQKLSFTYGTGSDGNLQVTLQTYLLSDQASSALGTPITQVTYNYDSTGRLTKVTTDLTPDKSTDNTDPKKLYVSSYTYMGSSSLVASVTQGDGTSVSFTYDGTGRVATITDAQGTQTFRYQTGSTQITYAQGTPAEQAWTYRYDSSNRLTEIDAPSPTPGSASLVTVFAYYPAGSQNGAERLHTVTDAAGRTVTYGYDANGNRNYERDSFGNTIQRTFDLKTDRLLTETHYTGVDPDGDGAGTPDPATALTTYYVYDSQARLRFVITPEGRVTENRYGTGLTDSGLLTRTISYAGGRLDTSKLDPGNPPSESQLSTWVAGLDQSQVEQAIYQYDYRGNVSQVVQYANTNPQGAGVLDAAATVTSYIHDGYGQLVQTLAVRGDRSGGHSTTKELTSYAYDGLGRQTTQKTAAGTTTTVYDGAARTIQISTASGLVETRTFDTTGHLVSLTQVDTAPGSTAPARTIQYAYDALGRLTMTQNAQGARQFSFYDGDGRLQYAVDETGAVTGYGYNADGQLISQTRYANAVDSSGWVQNNGSVTKQTLTIGAHGDLSADPQNDRTTTYDYDTAGRLMHQIVVTAAGSTVTTTHYDGDSRITSVQTGDRLTQYYYDRDGLRVGVLDPLGYLTESKYDAAGRLVQTIRYTTRSPMASDVSAPVWPGATNGVLQTTAHGTQPFVYHVPAAYDADGDTVTYSAVGSLPSWLTFDPVSLTLSGTPPKGLTTYNITLQASDGRQPGPKTTNVTVAIAVVNAPPSWVKLPDVSTPSLSPYSLTLPLASDVDTPQSQLTYGLVSGEVLPQGLSFGVGASGPTLSGTPTIPGSYLISVQVKDNGTPQLSTIESFVLQVTNQGPTWLLPAAIPDANHNIAYNLALPAAVDPEALPLTYRVVSGPSWLVMGANHTLTGTPPIIATPGPQAVVLEAQDQSGATVRTAFLINVINLPPTWATLTAPPPIRPGDQITYTLSAPALDPELQKVTYSAAGLPFGWRIDADTGTITGKAASSLSGNITLTLTASDPNGGSVSQTIVFRPADNPPVYNGSLPDQVTLTLSGPSSLLNLGNVASMFTDPDGDPLIIVADPDNPQDLSFTTANDGSLVLLVVNELMAPGSVFHTRVGAEDPTGLTVFHSITVTVVAPPAPPPASPPPTGGGGGGGGHPPGGPPTHPNVITGGGAVPTAPLSLPPMPTLVSPADDPLTDVLGGIRPSDPTALSSYNYYDGEGRLIGTVNEQGFLSTTVFDEQNNKRQSVRYITPVSVTPGATLHDLESAGGATETTTFQYNDLGLLTSVRGPDQSVTTYQYDAAGRVVRQVMDSEQADARASDTRYDAFGDVTGAVGGVGDQWLAANPTKTLDDAIKLYGVREEYDSLGRLIKSTQSIDGHDHSTLYFYDADSRLTHTVDALGDVSETTYDSFGDVAAVRRYYTTISLGGLTGGSNATLIQLLGTARNSRDQRTVYHYNQRGLLNSEIVVTGTATGVDGQPHDVGFQTTDSYDLYGQLASQTRTISLDANSAPAKTTTTQYDYDLDGQLIGQTDDIGGLNFNQRVVYDGYGRVIDSIDAAGKVTQTQYLDNGRTVQVTDPLGIAHVTKTLDANHIQVIDPFSGQATTTAYDHVARTVTVTSPLGVSTVTTMNAFGQVANLQDGRHNTTNYEYDADGHLTGVIDALHDEQHKLVSNTYDTLGRLSTSTDARGTLTQYTYDALNRVHLKQVDPSGLNLTSQYTYNALGQQDTVTQALGTSTQQVTQYSYDQTGLLHQAVLDPQGLKLATTYQYDGLGNTTQVSRGTVDNPNQRVTAYVFDALGRKVKEIDAPSDVLGTGSASERDITTEYRYDSAGRLSRTINANGQSTWLIYDDDGRLTYTIDALGGISQNFYDADGRVVQTRRYRNALSRGSVAAFGDAVSSSAISLAPSSADQRSYFVHDNDGNERFTLQAVGGGAWIVSEKRYDANRNVVETRTYDLVVSNSNIANLDGTTPLQGLTIDQVQTGLRSLNYADQTLGSSTTDVKSLAGIERTRYAYDADNRLRFTVDALGYVDENDYDAAGNVLTHTRYASVPTLSAYDEGTIDGALNASRSDPANRITRFAYDAAGRLRFISREVEPGNANAAPQYVVTEQVFDALGRLVQTVAYANSVTASVNYNDPQDLSRNGLLPSSQDRITQAVYDAAGHEVYSLRALSIDGSRTNLKYVVTQQVYDALGHLARSVTYANPVIQTDTSGSKNTPALLSQAMLDSAVQALAQDPANRSTRFAYDALGRLRFVVAADNTLSETVYDSLGQVTEQRQFDLQVSPSVPITEAALVQLRSARHVGDGVTRGESYTYDALGHLLSTTDAAGYSDRSYYDVLGNKSGYVDKNGMVLLKQHGNDPNYFPLVAWQYNYDLLGRVLDQYSPQAVFQFSNETAPPPTPRSLRTHYTRDAFGNLRLLGEALETVDVRITSYNYDKLNRQTSVGLSGWYDPGSGQVVSRAALPQFPNAFTRALDTTYDAFGDVVRTRLAVAKVGGLSQYQYDYKTYDNLGNQIHEINPLGEITEYAYDNFGDQRAVTQYSNPLNSSVPPDGIDGLWSADEVAGALTAMGPDSQARTVSTIYDNLGRKSTVTQSSANYYFSSSAPGLNPSGVATVSAAATTRFDYDVFGDLVHEATLIDTNGAGSSNGPGTWRDTWHYFDVLGRETLTVDALGYQTVRNYDNLGNLLQITEYANAGGPVVPGSSTPPTPPALSSRDRITIHTYDALGRELTVTRRNVHYAIYFGNDANGAPIYVQIEAGRDTGSVVQTLTYDAMGHVKTQTDALGNVTSTEYDILGEVTRVTAPVRQVANPGSLDPFLNQITVSPVTTYTYNAFGQVATAVMDPQGTGTVITTTNTYDNAGNLIAITDTNQSVTHRKYDYAGRLIDESRQVSAFFGGDVKQSLVSTLETKYVYDALGRLTDTLQLYGANQQTGDHRTYNHFGEVKQVYKEWGAASLAPEQLTRAIVAQFSYDNAGHLVDQRSGSGETIYFYDLTGNVTRQEQSGLDSVGNADSNHPEVSSNAPTRVTESAYDVLGRIIMQRLPAFAGMTPFSQQTYDRWGNVLSRSDGGNVQVAGAGLPLKVTGGFLTSYEYNADNQVIAQHDSTVRAVREDTSVYQANVTHLTQYDQLGRAVIQQDIVDDAGTAQVEANILRTRLKQYDAVGNLITETDATGHSTRYAYDGNGNRVGTLNALGTVTVDSFDANGNILTHGILRQADGSPYVSGGPGTPTLALLNRYSYDQVNRRTADFTVDGPIGSGFNYTQYDERGLVLKYYDGTNNGTTTYTYDSLGNKTQMIDAVGGTQNWFYSTNPNDFTVGRLQSWTGGTRTTTYHYNDFGQLLSETFAGDPAYINLYRLYEYWENGLLEQTTYHKEAGTSTVGQSTDNEGEIKTFYGYDARGEQTVERMDASSRNTAVDVQRTTVTSYDALGRISEVFMQPPANGASPNENDGAYLQDVKYSYDELGNRRNINAVAEAPTNITTDPHGNPTNHVQPINTSDKWYTYDAEGRVLIVDGVLDGSHTHIVTDTNSTVLSYDALGRRETARVYIGKGPGYDTGDVVVVDRVLDSQTVYTWDEYDTQRYSYTDQGYLSDVRVTNIEQIHQDAKEYSIQFDSSAGRWDEPVLVREWHPDDASGPVAPEQGGVVIAHYDYDGAGDLKGTTINQVEFKSPGPSDATPDWVSTTTSDYEIGGLQTQDVRNVDKTKNADITFDRDSMGNIKRETYTVQPGTGSQVTSHYYYQYLLEVGGERVSRIDQDTSDSSVKQNGYTDIFYDGLGNIDRQLIVQPSQHGENEPGGRGIQDDLFLYNRNGEVVYQTRHDIDEDPQGDGALEYRDYFYAAGQQVAVLGSGQSLQAAQFNNFTPISVANASGSPSTYTVNGGDTLSGIAQMIYGDSRLWYVIADANNLGFGPTASLSSEAGKTYRIPHVISTANRADTFTPYNPASIYGNNTPVPYLALPAQQQCSTAGAIIGMVVIVAAAALVSYATGGLATAAFAGLGDTAAGILGASVGAAAGDAFSQELRMGFGLQKDGFNGWEVLAAGVAAGLSKGLNFDKLGFIGDEANATFGAIGNQLAGVGGSGGGGSSLGQFITGGLLNLTGASTYLDKSNFNWSQAIAKVAGDWLDPASGWVFHFPGWATVISGSISPFEQAGINGVLPHQQQSSMPQSSMPQSSMTHTGGGFSSDAELPEGFSNENDGFPFAFADESVGEDGFIGGVGVAYANGPEGDPQSGGLTVWRFDIGSKAGGTSPGGPTGGPAIQAPADAPADVPALAVPRGPNVISHTNEDGSVAVVDPDSGTVVVLPPGDPRALAAVTPATQGSDEQASSSSSSDPSANQVGGGGGGPPVPSYFGDPILVLGNDHIGDPNSDKVVDWRLGNLANYNQQPPSSYENGVRATEAEHAIPGAWLKVLTPNFDSAAYRRAATVLIERFTALNKTHTRFDGDNAVTRQLKAAVAAGKEITLNQLIERAAVNTTRALAETNSVVSSARANAAIVAQAGGVFGLLEPAEVSALVRGVGLELPNPGGLRFATSAQAADIQGIAKQGWGFTGPDGSIEGTLFNRRFNAKAIFPDPAPRLSRSVISNVGRYTATSVLRGVGGAYSFLSGLQLVGGVTTQIATGNWKGLATTSGFLGGGLVVAKTLSRFGGAAVPLGGTLLSVGANAVDFYLHRDDDLLQDGAAIASMVGDGDGHSVVGALLYSAYEAGKVLISPITDLLRGALFQAMTRDANWQAVSGDASYLDRLNAALANSNGGE